MHGRQDVPDPHGCLDHLRNVLVLCNSHKGSLSLLKEQINVLAKRRLASNTLGLLPELLELLVDVVEEIGVGKQLLEGIADVGE